MKLLSKRDRAAMVSEGKKAAAMLDAIANLTAMHGYEVTHGATQVEQPNIVKLSLNLVRVREYGGA